MVTIELFYQEMKVCDISRIAYAPSREMIPIYARDAIHPWDDPSYFKDKIAVYGTLNTDAGLLVHSPGYTIHATRVAGGIETKLFLGGVELVENRDKPGEYVIMANTYMEQCRALTCRGNRKLLEKPTGESPYHNIIATGEGSKDETILH